MPTTLRPLGEWPRNTSTPSGFVSIFSNPSKGFRKYGAIDTPAPEEALTCQDEKKNKKEGRPKDETIRKDYKHSFSVHFL